jgi:hypothetical protein
MYINYPIIGLAGLLSNIYFSSQSFVYLNILIDAHSKTPIQSRLKRYSQGFSQEYYSRTLYHNS